MRARVCAIAIVCGMAIVGVWLYLSGCDNDNPIGPVPSKDYPVHFADINSTAYFTYHPATGVLDSFLLPFAARWGLAASPDGKILYVSTSDSVVAVELATLELTSIWTGACGGGVAVSPDNRLLAVQAGDLYILDAADLSVVYHDTDAVWGGYFSSDSKSFYCIAGGFSGRGHIYRVDLNGAPTLMRKWFTGRSPLHIRALNDGTMWFLYHRMGNWEARFEVYDVAADSVVFSEYMVPGEGYIELTPDEKRVFYTNPGPFLNIGQPDPPYTISIFDIEANHVIKEISTIGCFGGDTVLDSLAVTEVVATPDNRWLVGVGIAGDLFVAVDLQTLEVARWEKLDRLWQYLQYMTCQRNP